MYTLIIHSVLTTAGIYLLTGFIFSTVFLITGIEKTDEGAHGSGPGFRIMILPGCMLFWPLLLKKWLNAANARTQKKQDP